jgi:RimJ/RimL family protein N-acetyltransferase
VNWATATAEVGYGLHHLFVGKGFATKALALAEDRLRKMGFERIKITCQQWNRKSLAVAGRCGYELMNSVHEGRECLGCDDCTLNFEKRI